MQRSDKPHEELRHAEAAIEAMRSAASAASFEAAWKEFLHRAERVWSKTTAHFGKSPKWSAWHGKFEALRKADQLLSYLVNARGAEEHTVAEITGREPGGIGINAAEGNSLYIKRMEMRDGVLSIDSPQRLRIDFIPDQMTLAAVTNRGRTYAVPGEHLGKAIDARNVLGIAVMAISFYRAALAEAESFFVK
jgi:hypothetical protein